MKKFFTLIAMMFVAGSTFAQEWSEQMNPNADCEGTTFTYAAVKPNYVNGEKSSAIYTGDELAAYGVTGEAGSKCISVLAQAGAEQDWDSQFWICVPKDPAWEIGEGLKVSFKYRADWADGQLNADDEPVESITIGTQAHGDPGNYNHWACIGDVSFTKEWQTFEAEVSVTSDWIGSNGFKSIAFNLCQNNKDFDATFYFDDIEIYYQKPDETIVVYWAKQVQNGNFEQDATDNYVVRIYNSGGDTAPTIEEGIGVDDSRGIKITVPAKVSNDWDSQFFIKLKDPMPAGEMIKVSMDIRASEDGATAPDTQSHQTPGDYIYWACIGSPTFTSEWTTYTKTVSVSSDMSTDSKTFQTIAFNLAKNDHEVTYYFDNIDVRVRREGAAGDVPELIELNAAIDEASELYSNADGTPANKEIRDAFKAAYDAAQEAANYSGEEAIDYEAPMYALNSAQSKFNQSIKEYENLLYYINFTLAKVEEAKAMGDDYAQLYEDLDARQSAMNEAYQAEEMVKADMTEAGYLSVTPVMDIIKAAVNVETIKVGDDISILLPNAHYDTNGYDWQGTTPTVRAGVAEKWHATFDTYQTMPNLPAGAYEISAQGFQRRDMPGENDTWEQDAMNTKLYANNGYVYITDISDGSDLAGSLESIPNTMETAADLFATGACVNTLSVVLAEAGELKVGIKTDAKYTWAIWDNFKVIYKGANVESYAEAIKAMLNVATELQSTAYITTPVDKELNDAITKAEDLAADANLTEAQAVEAVDMLVAIIEATKTNEAALTAAEDMLYGDFAAAIAEYSEYATKAVQAKAAAAEAKEAEMLNMTTAELEAYLAELKYLAKALLVPGESENATDAEPYDMVDLLTAMGVDYDFEDYSDVGANKNYPGWSGSGFGTGGGTAGPVGERWNQTSGFNTYVTIEGLPEGIYSLTCDGAYRIGSAGSINDYNLAKADTINANIPYLYATTSEGTAKTYLPNVYSALVTEEIAAEKGLDFSSSDNATVSVEIDSVTTVKYLSPQQLATADQFMQAGYYNGNKVNFKVGADGQATIGVRREKGASNDWCFVDNFVLMYYGAKSAIVPDAINNVQVVANNGIYTITGLRVNNANKAGLYIINGKKVLVK